MLLKLSKQLLLIVYLEFANIKLYYPLFLQLLLIIDIHVVVHVSRSTYFFETI